MIMPVTLSVITTSFPAEERANAVGVRLGVAGGSGIIGFFVSAAIVDSSTWPWVFAFPIALAVLAFVGTVAVVPHSRSHAGAGSTWPAPSCRRSRSAVWCSASTRDLNAVGPTR
ncbi:MAG: MFS transporter [Acidimicrobiia bacterium]